MNAPYGLTDQQLTLIVSTLAQFTGVERAILFGSRAKGTMHERSNIDIAIVGSHLDRHQLAAIAMAFDDTDLPYQVDIKSIDDIQNPALKEHIARIGQCIYP